MKRGWMLSAVILLWAGPAAAGAGELKQWQFNPQNSRIDIKLEQGTQPQAMVLYNPTRLVIDLPYTTGTGIESQKDMGPYISGIRVSQFDAQTTRMVLELQPDYTWYANQIKIEGLTPQHWQIDLPSFIPQADLRNPSSKGQTLEVPQPKLPKPKDH